MTNQSNSVRPYAAALTKKVDKVNLASELHCQRHWTMIDNNEYVKRRFTKFNRLTQHLQGKSILAHGSLLRSHLVK